jgi:hypothetical protein
VENVKGSEYFRKALYMTVRSMCVAYEDLFPPRCVQYCTLLLFPRSASHHLCVCLAGWRVERSFKFKNVIVIILEARADLLQLCCFTGPLGRLSAWPCTSRSPTPVPLTHKWKEAQAEEAYAWLGRNVEMSSLSLRGRGQTEIKREGGVWVTRGVCERAREKLKWSN